MAIANAQTQSNEATANFQSRLNNTNVVGPFGDVTYVQDPRTDQWTQTTTLSPAEQSIFDAGTRAQATALGVANNQLGNVQRALDTPVTPVAPLATGVTPGAIQYGFGPNPGLQYGFAGGGPVQAQIANPDLSGAVQAATTAAYGQARSNLDPQWAQAAEQQQAQLTAQGLNPNDAAWQNAMTQFNDAKANAYNQANFSAIAAGDAEQNTLFNQLAQQGQFANAAQAQAYGENQGQAAFANQAAGQAFDQNAQQATFANSAQAQAFNQGLSNANLYDAAAQQQFQNQAYAQQLPINEFDALMSAGQVQAPSSSPAQTQVAPTNVENAYAMQQQALQADYQNQLASYNSGLAGLFGLGSAALKLLPL